MRAVVVAAIISSLSWKILGCIVVQRQPGKAWEVCTRSTENWVDRHTSDGVARQGYTRLLGGNLQQ